VTDVVVFETMGVRGGTIPLLGQHLERLARGAAAVGLGAPPDDLVTQAEALAGRGEDRILRLAWSAAGAMWSEREPAGPEAWKVAVVDEEHPGYPVKTAVRAAFDRALAAAEKMEADEAVLCTATGTVVEATRFALVWMEGEDLCYPDPDLGGLPSVGLARLRDVAAEAGVTTRAAWVAADGLRGVPVGLVNAARGLVRVEALDGRRVPDSTVLEELAVGFWPAA
jgi:branched-subunit amino acid aminotransferase/4-amino-4-deoxychorismate lyase